MKLGELGEFGFLTRLARVVPRGKRVLIGIGDDAALVRASGGRLLLTTDALVEDVHFRLGWDSPGGLGARAFAVNASDIAAMGGVPRFALLALGIPPETQVESLDALLRGFVRAARRTGCDLVGGNLSRAPLWTITVTLAGEPVGRPLERSGARPGDGIWVSGTLGRAARARELLLDAGAAQVSPRATLPFRRPTARLELGCLLAKRRFATSAIDVSDGLLQDLGHLCRASGVGARIDARSVPADGAGAGDPRRALELALEGGEDYELLFTVPPRREASLRREAASRPRLTRIGEIVPGRSIELIHGEGLRLRQGGHDHFRALS